MLRGILSGIFWGGIVVVVVVSVASLLAPLPATVTPQTSAVEGTEGSQASVADGALDGTSRTDDTVDELAQPEVAEPSASEAPPLADTDSAPRPETSTPENDLTTPQNPDGGGAVVVESDSPVLPNPQTETPDAPAAEDEPSISVNPPQPEVPDVTEEGAFPTPEPEPATEDMAEEKMAKVDPEDLTPDAEAGESQADEGEESLLKPAGELEEKFPQHKSDRIPSVGDEESAEQSATETALPRPVVANAEQMDNPDGKPVMAIVLVDVGDENVDLNALASFPYPLSIAVSTLDPNVKEKAAEYRSKGFEVLAMIDVPAAASASDVEVALDAHLSVVPEAVGVMEGLGDGLQGSKVVSDQVASVLAATGHGLVMFPNGLNTAQKLAAKEGVPSATVFRDFDSKGQSAVVMRRFLDQAAFKAGQAEGVVMVGRLREETVSALLLWGLQDRAGTVALAPVSAALQTIN
ncbi:divergent polysaccharide deacetylase family protein [Shimia sp.]|uniref:divergent polysaccharide deacetylase family protein n=1 Tax=Shimia sp. TaxID=1954381 RepID=UPI0032995B50